MLATLRLQACEFSQMPTFLCHWKQDVPAQIFRRHLHGLREGSSLAPFHQCVLIVLQPLAQVGRCRWPTVGSELVQFIAETGMCRMAEHFDCQRVVRHRVLGRSDLDRAERFEVERFVDVGNFGDAVGSVQERRQHQQNEKCQRQRDLRLQPPEPAVRPSHGGLGFDRQRWFERMSHAMVPGETT